MPNKITTSCESFPKLTKKYKIEKLVELEGGL